jgi:hypothetical protein
MPATPMRDKKGLAPTNLKVVIATVKALKR